MNIDILTLSDSAKLPERGSDMAAGYDLFADITEDIIIDPHTTAMIGTGSRRLLWRYFCQKRLVF